MDDHDHDHAPMDDLDHAPMSREDGDPAESWWRIIARNAQTLRLSPERLAAWSDPTNSDLDTETASALAAQGSGIVRAHLVGEGRDQWSEYFSTEQPRAVPVSDLRMYGAAAAKATALGDGWARVVVLWSADVPNLINGKFETQIMFTEVLFEQTPEGTWEPKHCIDNPLDTTCQINILQVEQMP